MWTWVAVYFAINFILYYAWANTIDEVKNEEGIKLNHLFDFCFVGLFGVFLLLHAIYDVITNKKFEDDEE